MNALEASQRNDWLDDAARGMMNIHLDDFVAGARACIGYCYGYGGLVLAEICSRSTVGLLKLKFV